MSLQIKTQQPISIILPFQHATLAQLQAIIPGITEIVGVYFDLTGEFSGSYIYRVLAPYSFAPPTRPIYGNRMDVGYFLPTKLTDTGKTIVRYDGDTPPDNIPSTLLAQDTVYILFYDK